MLRTNFNCPSYSITFGIQALIRDIKKRKRTATSVDLNHY